LFASINCRSPLGSPQGNAITGRPGPRAAIVTIRPETLGHRSPAAKLQWASTRPVLSFRRRRPNREKRRPQHNKRQLNDYGASFPIFNFTSRPSIPTNTANRFPRPPSTDTLPVFGSTTTTWQDVPVECPTRTYFSEYFQNYGPSSCQDDWPAFVPSLILSSTSASVYGPIQTRRPITQLMTSNLVPPAHSPPINPYFTLPKGIFDSSR